MIALSIVEEASFACLSCITAGLTFFKVMFGLQLCYFLWQFSIYGLRSCLVHEIVLDFGIIREQLGPEQ